MEEYHLNQTAKLSGPTKEQIIVQNQWAAVALDRYHVASKTQIEFTLEGTTTRALLNWDSMFSKVAMKEDKDIANHGGEAMAMFVMAVLLDYGFVEQTEIGDGVDYRFIKSEPDDDDLNFLNDYHFVEVSGILEESSSNTLKGRVRDKHDQINRGGKKNESSSVIVTLFSEPKTVKEIHK